MAEQRARRRERGQVIPIAALMMIVIVGFAALVIDGGRGYVDKRDLQAAADAGALSGAVQLGSRLVNNSALHAAFDMGCAVAAAANEVVQDLPNTSVPAKWSYSGGGKCPTLGTFSYDSTTDFPTANNPNGAPLGNNSGYFMKITANTETVQVTLHHSLSLTFGVAAKFGPSILPGATATAINGGLPFALVLFRTNCDPNSTKCENLTSSGSGVTLNIDVAGGSSAFGNMLTNESVCPAPGIINFNNSGDLYSFAYDYSKFFETTGSATCGTYPANVENTVSNKLQLSTNLFQLPNPNYPEPAVTPCSVSPCGTDLVVDVGGPGHLGFECIRPGTYSSIKVKSGILYLLPDLTDPLNPRPGVYRVDDSTGSNVGFVIQNGATVTDTIPPPALGLGGCPLSVPSQPGTALEMKPVGAAGDKNQLVDSGSTMSSGSFTLHSAASLRHIAVYVEDTPPVSGVVPCLTGTTDPTCWSTAGGGSQVINFQAHSHYNVQGVLYGYGDNMSFGGGSGGQDIGQAFAWTFFINGNGSITETYDPSQIPFLQGLLH
jgi:hypothetical protein